MTKDEFLKLSKTNRHLNIIFEARNELRKFCDEHWEQLVPRVHMAYKDMWSYIYSFFDGNTDNDLDPELAFEAYAVIVEFSDDLKSYVGKSPLEVAQMEYDAKGGETENTRKTSTSRFSIAYQWKFLT